MEALGVLLKSYLLSIGRYMNYSIFKLSVLSIFVFFIGHVSAEAPNVPTKAPYIVLGDNLDEPNGYGFCIDTEGAGESELLHSHSCKPVRPDADPNDPRGNDTRFAYDPATKQISAYAFGGCMQVLTSVSSSVFALLDCSDHPHQKFIYNESDKTFRLDADQSKCVATESETLPAGAWVKRMLTLADCSEVEAESKQWLVVSA